MGPSIVMTAMVWRMVRSISGRCVLFALSTAAVALVTPVLRTIPLSSLPDPIEAYIIPVPGLSNFVFFPWMGFVFSGALMGVVIDRATNVDTEKRVNLWLAGSGLIVVGLASIGSMLPSPLHSHFWTTSPSYFFIRIGLAAVAVSLAYAWTHAELNRRFTVDPIVQLGRTSLFIYWIHVELVYGLICTQSTTGSRCRRHVWRMFCSPRSCWRVRCGRIVSSRDTAIAYRWSGAPLCETKSVRRRDADRRSQHDVVARASLSGLEPNAALRLGRNQQAVASRVAARKGNDAVTRERVHFARLADSVAVDVMPQREVTQLAILQLSVAVVVERGQRFVAVVPEQPERNVAEPLERG